MNFRDLNFTFYRYLAIRATSIENFGVGHQIPLIVDFVSDRTKIWKCSRGRASGEAA